MIVVTPTNHSEEPRPANPPKFTATEQKILEILSDGEPHHISEIQDKVFDKYTERTAMQLHISNIRAKLRHMRQGILALYINRKAYYCRVVFYTP